MFDVLRRSRLHLTPLVLLVTLCGVDPADAQPDPLCKIAADPDYGRTKDRPVQVGGFGTTGVGRERRYLSALRGPKGEALTTERVGSGPGPDADTLVDIYTVTYAGLETPLTLYLDWYHYTELFAPQGFICGNRLDLGPPSPDPFQADEQLAALAATVASARGFRSPPVPLGDNGEAGIVLDPFRLLSRRQTAKPATPRDPATKPGTAVVIYPRQCEGRAVAPTSIVFVSPQGQEFPAGESFTDTARIVALAPGQKPPPGTLASTFAGNPLGSGLDVRVTYADGCGSAPATHTYEIAYSAARLVDSPMPARLADDTTGVPWVAVQAIIDHTGVFQEARSLGGPEPLARTALEAIKGWKVMPARANGAPLTTPVVLMVSFVDKPPAR